MRELVLLEERVCQGWPDGSGCGQRTTVVDHVVPTRQGGAPFARSNLRGYCKRCHDRKTAAENAAGGDPGA
jgi:5-methylcytosine-specific restriction endonuclease McrA